MFKGTAFLLFLIVGGCGLCAHGETKVPAEEKNLEDPTKPSDFVGGSMRGGGDEASGDLRLEAIIISGIHRVAVINQKVLSVGDTVGAKKLIAIEEKKVVLREGKNKESTLTLFETKVKEAAL